MKHYFNTNKVLSVTALAIGAITIFFACKKDDKAGADNTRDNQTIAAATQEAEINAIYEDAFSVTLDYNTTESDLNGGNRKAPDATWNNYARCTGVGLSIVPANWETYPKVVTIDFHEGCTDDHGRTRKGKLIITVDKIFVSPGAQAVVTFDNYSVNDIKVEGTQTIQNLSSDAGFGYSYTIVDGKLTYPSGKKVTYSGNRNVLQKEGATTPWVILDDIYELTGSASLKDSSVIANVTIKSGLVRKISCPYISKGVVELMVNSFKASIDYGNGDCDKKAVLTVGDKTKEIELPR
ncbi:hypothetical protein GFS24_21420 [Chitinophaga sp. SYP-B3965]|uniref:hypothetical protein n=1 Tax=Chitinophaga sp. SYP-B3965 TaxID=2663120 RepID=UPI001299EEDE|nr:hypothetical protein [Chitinophaga sp. SYP-B3965]MRG47697.1 hypothetical protein [Chitinophaga sp. SYP-B3965]